MSKKKKYTFSTYVIDRTKDKFVEDCTFISYVLFKSSDSKTFDVDVKIEMAKKLQKILDKRVTDFKNGVWHWDERNKKGLRLLHERVNRSL